MKALTQLLALEERKIEPLEKAVQQKSIMSTQEEEDCHILVSLLLILGTHRKDD